MAFSSFRPLLGFAKKPTCPLLFSNFCHHRVKSWAFLGPQKLLTVTFSIISASSGDNGDVAKQSAATFTSLHVRVMVTSSAELCANALLSIVQSLSLSLAGRFCHLAGRPLCPQQAVSVDSSIYISDASEVSCVESTDACTVDCCRLKSVSGV